MTQQRINTPKFKNTKKYLSNFNLSTSIVFKTLLIIFLIVGIIYFFHNSIQNPLSGKIWIPGSFGISISVFCLVLYITYLVFDIRNHVKKIEITPQFITLLKTIALTAAIANMFCYFMSATINNAEIFSTVSDSFLFIYAPFIMLFDFFIFEYKNKLIWIHELYGLSVSFLLIALVILGYFIGYYYELTDIVLALIFILIPAGIMYALIAINHVLHKAIITNKGNISLYNSILIKSLLLVSGIVGLIVQFIVVSGAFSANWWTGLMFFTIQSNIWIIVTVLCFLIIEIVEFTQKRSIITAAARSLKLVFTVSISLTGIVFTFMLTPTLGGLNAFVSISNTLLHIMVPLVAIFDFLWFDFKTEHKYKDVPYSLIPPVYYTIFVVTCFYNNIPFINNLPYPYFFFNFGSPAGWFCFCNELPFMGSFYWILLIAGIITGGGFLYTLLMKRKRQKYLIH